jgi:RloB-like protein
MPPPHRGSSSLRRLRSATTRRIIRVHTEGTRTEPEYLTRLLDLRDRPVVLQIDPRHGVPSTLVANAIATKELNAKDARRGRDELIDEHWCIFDFDEHPNVNESIASAIANGVGVASSNPCFELWLVLHYVDLRRHEHRHTVQNLALQQLPGLARDPKGITKAQAAILAERYATAKDRASALDLMHSANQSIPRSNPSTDVWRIAERLATHPPGTATDTDEFEE